MKAIITTLALALAMSASAQNEVLKIELNDGTVQTVAIDNIKQMTFGTEEAASPEGTYSGTISVTVGGQFTYDDTGHSISVTENSDGTLKVVLDQYRLSGTMMGDLTIGTLTIDNIAYDEARQAYYRNYSGDGLKRHFTASKEGNTSMDADYPLGETSEITLTFDGDNVTVQNDFKLGAMPFPLASKYTGERR